MQAVIISEKEAGQRLDKFLSKYLNQASKSFLYKMLRKKNITLNGKKAEGLEKLSQGDEIKLYLSDETIEKFKKPENKTDFLNLPKAGLKVLYENKHILIMDKPAGMLSQKARPEDISLIEYMTAYLLSSHSIEEEELSHFRPGICNRLDRNTSGIIVGGKTMEGLQVMGELFKDRQLSKFYFSIVKGVIEKPQLIEGYLAKNHSHNRVSIYKEPVENSDYIKTYYEPVFHNGEYTFLKVKLITGKSHQIRAHLQSVGHSIIGDGKYGDVASNKFFRKNFKLKHQLLHAGILVFPQMEGEWAALSQKKITASLPDYFQTILKNCFREGEHLCRHGIQEV